MSSTRALPAGVDELYPQKNEDEDVKTYPMANGSCARHLWLDATARERWMHSLTFGGQNRGKERGRRFVAQVSMLRGRAGRANLA
jgi:hypothetical protein